MVKAPTGYFTILEFMTMSDLERNAALRQYRDLIQIGAAGAMEFAEDPAAAVGKAKRKAKRKKSKYSRALSAELRKANAAARTKSGKLRKGMTPEKILKKAHKAVKRRLK